MTSLEALLRVKADFDYRVKNNDILLMGQIDIDSIQRSLIELEQIKQTHIDFDLLIEQRKVLNKYRNNHYNANIGSEELEVAKALNKILPTICQMSEKIKYQERLLNLYRKLSESLELSIDVDTADEDDRPVDFEYLYINTKSEKALEIYKQILELE
jgi:hypothetical protein